MAEMTWERRRAIERAEMERVWEPWAKTVGNPIDRSELDRTDARLAKALGLPVVPKHGALSIGWCLSKMANLERTSGGLSGAMAPAMARLRGGTASPVGILLAQIAAQRALYAEGCNVQGPWGNGDVETHLFSGWGELQEATLEWCLARGPCDGMTGPTRGRLAKCHLDDRGRPHSPEGPALQMGPAGNYSKIFAIHGVMIDDADWDKKGDASKILKVANVEVRRVLIEDMGTMEFVRAAGLRHVHEDATGRLYKNIVSAPSGRGSREISLCWVHVVCPSTGREYMLAVPPNTRTAHEGVAWTFGKVPEDYVPGVQT